jgi:RHS repeat-associated protein
MSNYNLKVGNNAKDFNHKGQTYKAGSTYETNDPCDALAFFNSYSGTNVGGGRSNATPDFWQNMEKACAANAGASPGNAAPGGAKEGPPAGDGDSAEKQGAPAAPENVAGVDTQAPGPGTGDDAPGAEEDQRPADGDPHGTRSGEQNGAPTTGGDPVDLFSGRVYLDETDLEIPNTVLPLALVRAYRSGPGFYCPFGWNWDHNHNLFIRELSNGDLALWRIAHEERFVFTGADYEPPRGIFEQMKRVGASRAFDLTGAGGVVSHFEQPAGWTDAARIPIQFLRDRHGNQLTYFYDPQNNLVKVQDDDGRFIAFDYDQCNLIVSAFDHAGRRYRYEHDEEGQHLVFVTKPATGTFPDGVTRRYDYPTGAVPPSVRHNLLRITDSEGNTYLENSYEEDPASPSYGRVVAQLYGDYLYQFSYEELQFVVPSDLNVNVPAVQTEVLNPEFGLETYTFNFRGDLLDRRYRLNRDGTYRVCVWQYGYDGQANLTRTVKPDGSEDRHVFDDGNADPRMRGCRLRTELIAASGFPVPSRIVWRGDYEPRFQLPIRLIDEAGAVTRMRYDFDLSPGAAGNSGKLKEVLHPDVTLPDGTGQSATTRFEYNARGQVTATILADGTRNEVHYGTAGAELGRLVETVDDVGGLAISNRRAYDAVGFVIQNIDGNGAITQRVYNALGQLEKLVRPAVGGITAEERYQYNSDGRVVRIERPKGAYALPLSDAAGSHFIDLFERDVLGYARRVTLSSNCPDSRATRHRNDYRGVTTEMTTPDGAVVHTVTDERQLPVEEKVVGPDGLQIRSRNGYDRAGKLVRQIDVFGGITRYEHDGFGRVRTTITPAGTELRQVWLPRDLLASEEVVGDDGTGVVRRLSFVRHAYDEKGRRTATTQLVFEDDPAVSTDYTTRFFHDVLDRMVRAVDERGATLTRRYDGVGRLIEQTDPMGNVERNVHDAAGNLVERHSDHVEPGGGVSTISKRFEFDPRGRRTAMIEPDGARVTYDYDDRDLVVRTTDRLGIVTTTDYDSFNVRTGQVHDVNGLAIAQHWQHDMMSRITAYVDAMGETSRYGYDTVGRQTSITYPGGFSSQRTYNQSCQIVKERLASGVELDFTYDAANRLTRMANAAAPAPVRAIADHQFRYDGLNRVIDAVAGTSAVLRAYDSRGRLLRETNHGSALSCRYDDAAGTVEKRWPDGRAELLEHDLGGHLASITQTANGSLGAGIGELIGVSLSGPGALAEARLRGGAVIANRFDERKRVTDIALSSPAGVNEQIHYRYDAGDRRRVEGIVGAVPKTSYFEFDPRKRLVLARDRFAASIPAAADQTQHDSAITAVAAASVAAAHVETFAYDPADARTAKTETGVPAHAYTYAPGHRLIGDGVDAYTHSVDGPFSSAGAVTYESDALGRIVAVRSGGVAVLDLEYDAFGRISTVRPAGEAARSFCYLGAFIEQEIVGGAPERQMTLHPATGVPVAYHRAGATHFALVDARFNLLGLVDTNGQLVEAYRYKSFGTPQIFDAAGTTRATSAFGIRPVFGGQSWMAGAGLYLATKRVMDPELGQFLSPDPLGYPDSPMLYGYAAQNPVDLIDPSGEIIPFIVAAFVIGGAVAGAGYSVYDAYHHPEKYEGGWGTLRIFGNVFGGAIIGGVAIVGGEAVLAVGGTGIFAGGAAAGGGLASLSAVQTFVLYGTSSVVSGGILRAGFNGMFPDYVNPVSAGTVAFDFVAGGAFATVARAFEPTFNTMKAGLSSWWRYGLDQGGSAAPGASLGPYPGKIGQWLDKVGIRQGSSSVINNLDAGGSWFARADTAAHEGFHAFVLRYFPTFRELSLGNGIWSAAARYPEEVIAYAIGHGASLRPHGIPFAPLEAFNSLGAYSAGEQLFAKLFWGSFWAGLSAYAINEASSGSSSESGGGGQAQPNQKPAGAK